MSDKSEIKIPVAKPDIGEKELEYVTDCVKSTWISSLGEYIKKFESGFADFCSTKHAIAVSSGTTALHVALVALNIKTGDEVIVPDLTFAASANVVIYTGAKPVLVDVDKYTWTLDPAKIKEKITDKTKAIMPVHLYGHPCDMDPIMEIAQEKGIAIVEDAAEAHGAEYRGKRVGSIGDLGCFSFYGNKIITTGEGGMVTTNSDDLAARLRTLKDHAMSPEKRYWHEEVGYNYRLTNMQAAIGLAQLERAEEMINKRIKIAKKYNELLKDTNGVTLPPEAEWAKNVFWMYSILVEERGKVAGKLKENGIDTRPFFYPLHEMPPYAENEDFPVSTELSRTGLSLPTYYALTPEQIEEISKRIKIEL